MFSDIATLPRPCSGCTRDGRGAWSNAGARPCVCTPGAGPSLNQLVGSNGPSHETSSGFHSLSREHMRRCGQCTKCAVCGQTIVSNASAPEASC